MHARWNEADRLTALKQYHILDAPSEPIFGDVVKIATQICEAPIAAVNLIDEKRQCFAAEIGLGLRETSLDVSICTHAILNPGIFVVPDLSRDARFNDNPFVAQDPKLRFYGGVLLETSDGFPLGTIFVLDYQARPQGLTENQAFTLKALARQVMTQLELRRVIAEKELLVQEAHHRIKNSLQMLHGLLLLQAKASLHSDAAQQLRQSAARVMTFGAMHEHLYRVGAGSAADLSEYMRNLIEAQHEALGSMLEGRDITLDTSAEFWPSSHTPTVGLIALELITNALKHGSGSVAVKLLTRGDELMLSVEDEGTSLPANYDFSPKKGLGMRMLNELLKSHRGRIELDSSRGHTCFIVRMRKPAD